MLKPVSETSAPDTAPERRGLPEIFLHGLADAAALLNAQLSPVAFNYAYGLLSGLKRRELERRAAAAGCAFELLGAADGVLKKAAASALASGRELRLEAVTLQNAAGEPLTVLATFIPFCTADAGQQLLVIFRDVSDDERVQAKYKELLAVERSRADELEREVEARTSALRSALDQVTRLSNTDPLTGIANRRAFTDAAQRALQLAKRHGRTLALVFCDLDHFKRLNDTWGHQAGDAILSATSKALSETIRRTDLLARFGGEEFMLLLNEAHESRVLEVGTRCLQRVRELPVSALIPGSSRMQTMSAGIAIFPKHGDTLDELVRNADRALYHSKATGRDRVTVYEPALQATAQPSRVGLLRVLLLGEERAVLDERARLLSGRFESVVASDFDQGLDLAVCEQIDAVVVDQGFRNGRGLEFLSTSLVVQPSALRVLVTPSQESYAAIRKSAPGGADLFLLASDAHDKLTVAVEDGLAQQQMSHRPSHPQGLWGRHFPDDLVRRLDVLVETGAMSVAYQPVFETETRKIFAYEALARAEDPLFRDPQVLFDGAVRSGRIWKLSRLTRARAVAPMDRLPPEQLLFLNLHPSEVEDPRLPADPALLPWASRIVLEITERAALPDLSRFRRRMDELRALGFRFAVDDLGAGYASLNSVALLEPDFVKLDRVTVSALPESPRLCTLVRRIVDFANDAGIKVVGEGVEREAELRVLKEVGCHLVQGFLLASPSPAFL